MKYSPKRTTILSFITAHIHSATFSYATHRATTEWLSDSPSLWDGGEFTAVFASCAEHFGAKYWAENVTADTYTPTEAQNEETLYAATAERAALTFREWNGATPGQTRVINPLAFGTPAQGGEELLFLLNGIPEISLVTPPAWMLKEWEKGSNERTLVDDAAVEGQIESFERIWRKVDGMETGRLEW